MIANGLLGVYHDSFENALSSWLSERTCPYSAEVSSGLSSVQMESIPDEWGSSWSNRICTRVCQLDSASSGLRARCLTTSEDRKASRALKTAIMAFASQWSHTGPLSANMDQYSQQKDASNQFGMNDGQHRSPLPTPSTFPPLVSPDFGRSLQRELWHQARSATWETEGLDSFRAIFAHMIFALTQRPVEMHEREDILKRFRPSKFSSKHSGNTSTIDKSGEKDNIHGSMRFEPSNFTDTSVSVMLDHLAELEEPPLHLEAAVRHLFSWRSRIIKLDRQPSKAVFQDRQGHQRAVPFLPILHRKCFNMLFWLGIMCDTTSSAIIIPDEDSAIINTSNASKDLKRFGHHPNSLYDMASSESANLWGDYLLKRNDLYSSGDWILSWPCNPESAAATLCDATPIKVLSYRKVARLQTLSYRGASAEKLEDCIQESLKVLHQWNSTYGQFMNDCLHNLDQLPSRIQSWYVILICHWHLAGLLLADLIEAIDENGYGLDSQTTHRASNCFTLELRKEHAFAIASVARAASPCHTTSFPNSKEFHFAVSEAALLTEPWTDILIRSFSKAANILLLLLRKHNRNTSQCVPISDGDGSPDGPRELEANTVYCIQALRVLARKSDMADLVAFVLSTELEDLATSCAQPTQSSESENSGNSADPHSSFIQEICDLVSLQDDLFTFPISNPEKSV